MAADMNGAGLPAPESVEGLYLAAILDELRLLRQAQAPSRPAEPPAGEMELREPMARMGVVFTDEQKAAIKSMPASPAENKPAAAPAQGKGKKRS